MRVVARKVHEFHEKQFPCAQQDVSHDNNVTDSRDIGLRVLAGWIPRFWTSPPIVSLTILPIQDGGIVLKSAERFALSPSWQQRDQSSRSQPFERCTGIAALNPISLRHAGTRFTSEGLVLRYLALAITFYQTQTEFRLLWSKIGNMLEPNILPTHDRQHILEGLKSRKYTLFYQHKVSRNPIETHRKINSYCNTLL